MRKIAIVLLVIFLFSSVAHAQTIEELLQKGSFGIDVTDRKEEIGSSLYEERFQLSSDRHISVRFENASIVDIFSVIALHMGKNILFVEEPIITSFEILNVDPMIALEMLLRKEGLSHIERDNLLVIGEPSRILDAFFDLVMLQEFRTTHITANQFDQFLAALGVPLQRLLVEGNRNTLWVRGLPQELVLVRDIHRALDIPENAGGEEEDLGALAEMVRVDLEYISPNYLVDLAKGLSFEVDILQPEWGRNVIWLRGSPARIREVQEFISFVDDPSNIEEKLPMKRIDLLFIPTDILLNVARQARLEVDIYTIDYNKKALWAKGTERELSYLEEIVKELDIAANQFVTKDFVVFAYELENVTPVDAINRIPSWEFPDLKIIGFNFPHLGNDLLVLCPSTVQDSVVDALNAIDEERREVRIPIMTSQGIYPEDILEEWRDLLIELFEDRGIDDDAFIIPEYDLLGGMGRYITHIPEGETEPVRLQDKRQIMYMEATPDKIQLVTNMLVHLGAPGVLGAMPHHMEMPGEEEGEEEEENKSTKITEEKFDAVMSLYVQGSVTYEEIKDIVGGPGNIIGTDPLTVTYMGETTGTWARFVFHENGVLKTLEWTPVD